MRTNALLPPRAIRPVGGRGIDSFPWRPGRLPCGQDPIEHTREIMIRQGGGRLGTRDKYLHRRSRLVLVEEDLLGHLKLGKDNAERWLEILNILVGGELRSPLHEFGPYRQGRARPAEPQFPVVVIADPNRADQIARITHEPTVTRSAGLARCRRIEPLPSNASSRARLMTLASRWVII